MRIEHAVHATIPAPIDTVWATLGAFGDMSWNPHLSASVLINGESTPHVGSIRELRSLDGTTIRERLDAIGPGYSFTYSFDGEPPGPVSSSSTTVSATPTAASPDSATDVTWHGVFGVADVETGVAVAHLNRDIVWPALISALASSLGVEATFHVARS